MFIIVAAITNGLKLRRLCPSPLDELFDCFPDFESTFDGLFEFVARFNLAKNSFVINVGSFNNGIYVPSSKNKNKNFVFINNSNHQFVLIHNEHVMEIDVFQMKQILNLLKKDEMVLRYLININQILLMMINNNEFEYNLINVLAKNKIVFFC